MIDYSGKARSFKRSLKIHEQNSQLNYISLIEYSGIAINYQLVYKCWNNNCMHYALY